jgi:hypothetical protein
MMGDVTAMMGDVRADRWDVEHDDGRCDVALTRGAGLPERLLAPRLLSESIIRVYK